ncbi:MAG: 23S rRNA (adenine(2503)-C(2))-methyltransferase RlmN [Lachnospiraceae bacterium]|nr:23S rRNA (adenine(2503)-C(2))-methyltransferase RlmN [Lachnospiraceae bacterium]
MNEISDNIIDLKNLTLDELTAFLKDLGQPSYRAKQMYAWMHQKLAAGVDEMTNLPKSLRDQLKNETAYTYLQKREHQISQIDGTQKFLWELCDGHMVESVWMPYHHGNSVCISSQVGCRMGCKFCASGIGGLVRNMTAAEMLDEIYRMSAESGERVSNVVVMGTGEPLDNYDQIFKFIRMLTDENGLNISQRNVTVSTCGLVDQIRQLAKEKLQITLAISLHAAFDEKRKQIMPIAYKYSIDELVDAAAYYAEQTGRRVTFEYSLIEGNNDTDEDIAALTHLAKRAGAHVNLIPVNPVTETGFRAPKAAFLDVFKNKLEKNHINVTIRRSMGRDIDGACGQLRRKYLR